MTVSEAAARLDVEYDYVLRLIRQGRLRATKIGRVWDVHSNSVTQRLLAVAEHRAKRVNHNQKG
jgi:excisionase family DNA binding protein